MECVGANFSELSKESINFNSSKPEKLVNSKNNENIKQSCERKKINLNFKSSKINDLYKPNSGDWIIHFPKIQFNGPMKLEVSDSIEMVDELIDESNSNEPINPDINRNDLQYDQNKSKEIIEGIQELKQDFHQNLIDKDKTNNIRENNINNQKESDFVFTNLIKENEGHVNYHVVHTKCDKVNIENINSSKNSDSFHFIREINNEEKGDNNLNINVWHNFKVSSTKLIDYQNNTLIVSSPIINSKSSIKSKSSINTYNTRRKNSLIFSLCDSSSDIDSKSLNKGRKEFSINSLVSSIQINPNSILNPNRKLEENSNSKSSNNYSANNQVNNFLSRKGNAVEFVSCLSFEFRILKNSDSTTFIPDKAGLINHSNPTNFDQSRNFQNEVILNNTDKLKKKNLYLNYLSNKKDSDECLYDYLDYQSKDYSNFPAISKVFPFTHNSNPNFQNKLIEYKEELKLLKEEISKIMQYNLNKIVILNRDQWRI